MAAIPFKHDFNTIVGLVDMAGVKGYTQCLQALYDHVKQVTKFNPELRYIDSVELLERIIATNTELAELVTQSMNSSEHIIT